MLCALPALADSDGYFCVGPTYLAYETRSDSPKPEHRLHVVRIGPGGTLRHGHRLIPDFQVHGMKCEPDVVHLDGWDRMYEVSVFFAVDLISVPHEPGKLRGLPLLNLAQWNRAATTTRTQRIGLPWPGSRLEIRNRRGSKHCQYEVESRVVRGPETVILLDRTFERDCGD